MRPPNLILRQAYDRKKSLQPSFSVRKLGTLLKLSPSFVSALLNGKRPVPLARLNRLGQLLEIDEAGLEQVRYLENFEFITQNLPKKNDPKVSRLMPEPPGSLKFETSLAATHWVFDHWYYLAILELSTCHNFRPDARWVGGRLNISSGAADESLSRLTEAGYLVIVDGKLIKNSRLMRVVTLASRPKIREFHRQLLQISKNILANQHDDLSFSKRLITSGTVAVNPQYLEAAKQILNDAVFKVSQLLSEGDCSEVYQVAVQLAPLTV